MAYKEVKSVIHALKIISSFTHEQPVKRVTDIAKELTLPKSTVSRLISNLVAEEYLVKDKNSSGYLLGPAVFTVGGVYLHSTHIFQEVTPVLTDIAYETKESVHISILRGYNVVYFNKSMGPYYADIESNIGTERPAYLTSSGKVMLADQEEEYIDKMFEEKLLSYTSHSVDNPEKFKEELAKIREQGYALSIGEMTSENYSLAVPVYDANDRVVCAIAIIAPIARMSEEKTKKFLNILLDAAAEAKERLEYAI